jgi:hypothetical protein
MGRAGQALRSSRRRSKTKEEDGAGSDGPVSEQVQDVARETGARYRGVEASRARLLGCVGPLARPLTHRLDMRAWLVPVAASPGAASAPRPAVPRPLGTRHLHGQLGGERTRVNTTHVNDLPVIARGTAKSLQWRYFGRSVDLCQQGKDRSCMQGKAVRTAGRPALRGHQPTAATPNTDTHRGPLRCAGNAVRWPLEHCPARIDGQIQGAISAVDGYTDSTVVALKPQ